MFGVDLIIIVAIAVPLFGLVAALVLCGAAADGDEIGRAALERRRREALNRVSGGGGWRRL